MKKFTHLSSNKTALKPISTELTIYKFPSVLHMRAIAAAISINTTLYTSNYIHVYIYK